MTVPNELTLKRSAVAETFIRFIVPRLAGADEERETSLEVILAHMQDQYANGVQDAAGLAQKIAIERPASREAAVLVKSLNELEDRSRGNPIRCLHVPARTA